MEWLLQIVEVTTEAQYFMGLLCLALSRTGRRTSISRIPGIPQYADVLLSMRQYFLCWKKASVALLSPIAAFPLQLTTTF